MGCSGLLQKLDALTAALWFIRFSSTDEDSEAEMEAKVERMLQFIMQQRRIFKVDKTRLERIRLEEIAANLPDLNDTATL